MGRSINTPMTERELLEGAAKTARVTLAFHQAEVEKWAARVAVAEKELVAFNDRERNAWQEAAGFTAGM